MKLYYHKTSGGAEYLTDNFIECENGHKEGAFEGANYVVRIDGDINKDAELLVSNNNYLLKACKEVQQFLIAMEVNYTFPSTKMLKILKNAINKAEN